MKALLDYLSGVRGELAHIKWPSTGQTIGYTAIVIGISLFVAVLLAGSDYVFTHLAAYLVNRH